MEENNKVRRPLDVLGSSLEKKIIIKTKFGQEISGVLKAFDSHINIWIEDAKIQDEKEVKMGKMLIRGDNIVFISPEK